VRTKLAIALVLVTLGLAVFAANVVATRAGGFSGFTVAKATFGEIDSHIHTTPADSSWPIRTSPRCRRSARQSPATRRPRASSPTDEIRKGLRC
jgi:hypothetical protein